MAEVDRELFVITDDRFALHSPESYPECPARLGWAWEGISEAAQELGLAVHRTRPPGALARPSLGLVHAPHYLRHLEELSAGGGGTLSVDTELTAESYNVAALAASAACAAVDACRGNLAPAIALVRPPGHHAGKAFGTGYCLLNNVAIAVRHAQNSLPSAGRKVAVVDWDVHHGNGTDEIFAADPDVLYVSMHEFPLYPYSGWMTECGFGAGEGTTVNLPLPGGLSDTQALAALRRVVLPVLKAFRPSAILVSAGQDGHWQDPMSSWRLTARGYAGMASELSCFAAQAGVPPPVVVLEGGYSAPGMAVSFAGITAGLLGYSLPGLAVADRSTLPAPGPRQEEAFRRRLEEIAAVQARFWPVS